MALEIRTLGDPLLREKCREIDGIDPEIKALLAAMEETLHATPGRAGLAAPQVGVLKRFFIFDMGFGTRAIINPEIIERGESAQCEEGCLSIPGISVNLPRCENVRMRCVTPSGKRITIEAHGFLSQVFQHECDHLDGVLIIDRCDEEERRRALAEYQELELTREQASA